MRLERSTVSGQKVYRKNRIKGLREAGYNVTEQTFDMFTEFMDEARQKALTTAYLSSDAVLQVAKVVGRLKLDIDEVAQDLDWWAENIDSITSAKDRNKIGIKTGMSSAQIQELVNKYKK